MKKTIRSTLLLLVAATTTQPAAAWEAYEFEVAWISVIADGSCSIGMKNLGPKSAEDPAICDAPAQISFNDCSTEVARMFFSLALTAKTSKQRMWHQAIYEGSPNERGQCTVQPYQLKLMDQ